MKKKCIQCNSLIELPQVNLSEFSPLFAGMFSKGHANICESCANARLEEAREILRLKFKIQNPNSVVSAKNSRAEMQQLLGLE